MNKTDLILDELEEQNRYLEQIRDMLGQVIKMRIKITRDNPEWEEYLLGLSNKIKEKFPEIEK